MSLHRKKRPVAAAYGTMRLRRRDFATLRVELVSGIPRAPGARGEVLALVLAAVGIFLLTTPFTFHLTGVSPVVGSFLNAATMRGESGSNTIVYLLRAGVAVAGIAWAMTRVVGGRLRTANVLPWVPFLLWSALSVAWSDQMTTSLNAVMSMTLLLVGAWAIAAPMTLQRAAQALLLSSVFVVTFSAIFIALLPSFGMHQNADVAQSVHAGAWRGIYLHKNHLGQLCAVYAAASIMAGRDIIPSRTLKWAWTGILIAIVMQTRSSSAIAIIALTPPILWILVVLSPGYRLVTSAFVAAATLLAVFGLDLLLGLIGRDATLTGRTTIWELAFQEISSHFLHGFGYMSISYGEFALNIFLRMGVRDPHNMYLDLLLGGGVIGLLLFLVPLVAAWLGAQSRMTDGSGEVRAGTLVLGAVVIAWMLAGFSESDARPLAGVLGLATFALLKLPPLISVLPVATMDEPPGRGRGQKWARTTMAGGSRWHRTWRERPAGDQSRPPAR